MLRKQTSETPDGTSSSSQGRSMRQSKRHSDTATAAPHSAVPVQPLNTPSETVFASTFGLSQHRLSTHRPSSTASFCSAQSEAAAEAAQDPERSVLVTADATELEVDAHRSREDQRVLEVPPSPAEESPVGHSSAGARLPMTNTQSPDVPGTRYQANEAPTVSTRTAEDPQALTAAQRSGATTTSKLAGRARRLAPAESPWQKGRVRMPSTAFRKCRSLEQLETLASSGGTEDHWSPSEGTSERLGSVLPPPHESTTSHSLTRRLSFLTKGAAGVSAGLGPKKLARVWPWPCVCGGLLALLLLAAVLVFVAFSMPNPDVVQAPRLCTSTDCADHATALGVGKYSEEGTRDQSDPCLDFGAFVCSAAPIRHPWTRLPLMTQVLFEYATQLGRRVSSVAVLAKATMVMRTCLDSSTRSDGDVERLLEFMDGRSFDWPIDEGALGDPFDYSRPLKALVELSAKWALPLWFDIDLRRSGSQQGRTIVQTSSAMAAVWLKLHIELEKLRLSAIYVETFLSTLISKRGAAPSFIAFLRRDSAEVQSKVFQHLNDAVVADIRDPKLMYLRSLGTEGHLPQLRSDEWARVLQWAFQGEPAITADDAFLATNIYVIRSMRRIFERMTALEVLFHTTWWFLQAVGPLASRTLSSFTVPSEIGSIVNKLSCGLHVEAVYHAALATKSKLEFSAPQRLAIGDLLRSVMKTALDKIRTMRGASDRARATLEAAFSNTTATVWPWGELSVLKSLEQYYGTSTGSLSAFGEWLSIRLQVQRFVGDRERDLATKVFRLESNRLASYDLIDNVILLCAAALTPPLYYTNGTSAMVYGGLGFVLGAEVAHTLHSFLALLKEEAAILPSGEQLLEMLWGISPCSDTYHWFPAVGGLQLAHAAYTRFRYAEDDVPLALMRNYTAEQVFFMTFCLTLCDYHSIKGWSSKMCNHAVKHLPAFAHAFKCPPESPMSTKPVCPQN
ncbi:endothelin-converting enzyme-like 1 [Dermacentor albipictus]|uniref:endothelin-converting enzyme-like 1 n=1 Tax=Dermacentor albipictus TaxID=60249 RepID=UPI0031FC62A8